MRLLIVGTLKGQLTAASKLAMEKGASVTHAESIDQALAVLRSGRGADLLMVDVALDIRDLVLRLDAERIAVPIVARGVRNHAPARGAPPPASTRVAWGRRCPPGGGATTRAPRSPPSMPAPRSTSRCRRIPS